MPKGIFLRKKRIPKYIIGELKLSLKQFIENLNQKFVNTIQYKISKGE